MAINIPIISSLDSKGFDKAITEFKSLDGVAAKTGFALKKAMVPAIAVLGGLATGLGLATAAAVEDQKAQDLLAQQLRTSAMATDDVIASNEEFISGMSRAFAVADDELRPAMANLVRSTGSVEVAQSLMSTALDIAAATGKDLETVTLALGKAANGQTGALLKLDPSLKGVIDSSSTLDDITGALAVSFGGAATVAAESFDGRMKSMKIAMDETKESIGAALLPVLQKLLELLQPVAKFAQENTKLFLIITGVIGGFAAAIIVANIAMKAFAIATQVASAAQAIFNFVMSANPIALVIIAVAAFVAALIILEQRFGIISKGFELFSAGFNQFIINPIKTAIRFISDLLSAFKKIPGVGSIGGFLGGINIPGFANGGIVTRPTLAMVGERGPEAIVPLSGGGGGGMGGVNINVTGGIGTSAQIGQAVYNALLQYKQVYGPLTAITA
jgi:hypothetical protein